MVEHGHALYDRAHALAEALRGQIEHLDGFHVYGREDFCAPGRAADLDPLQVIIDISALGTRGYRAADWLRAHHGVNLHGLLGAGGRAGATESCDSGPH
jgi:hypothetical protein